MPDRKKSTRHLPLPKVQTALVEIVGGLQHFDKRLRDLAEAIAPDPDNILPAELRAGVARVRTDLLSDAITSLAALAVLDEDAARQRRIELADIAEQIAAFG